MNDDHKLNFTYANVVSKITDGKQRIEEAVSKRLHVSTRSSPLSRNEFWGERRKRGKS